MADGGVAQHDPTEASLHEWVQRAWVRRASVIVVAGQGIAFLVGALLPTTPDEDRDALFVGAALVAVTGVAWFGLLPKQAFGAWRVFIAAAIAETVIHVVLAITGGVASSYFAFVFMPVLVMVMTGRPRQTLLLAGAALTGLVVLALLDVNGSAQPGTVRDLFAIRALEIATFGAAAAAIARAYGAVTATLSARGTTLAASARTDPLTGLGNRRALEDELRRMLAATERTRSPLTIAAIDLDGLKLVNDRLGHEAGDELLVQFARVLIQSIRGNDVAIRVGGDEFFLLLPDTSDDAARRVLERIGQRAGEVAPGWPVRFSAGVVAATPGVDASTLLKSADAALYADKAPRARPE